MAKRERDRVSDSPSFDLSDEEVNGRWKEIVVRARRNPGEATAAWDSLGEKYKRLGRQSAG